MSAQYDVTIGIPVYRAVQYIRDSLCSALNQTFPSIEFLIVDDCGMDGTMDIVYFLQKTHPRGHDIRILNNYKNYGVSFCRNRIIDEARGRFLFFMDADDMIEPDTIKFLYSALTQNHAQISYGSYDIIDRIGNGPTQVYQKALKVLEDEDALAIYAFKHNNIFHVSVCNCLIFLDFLRQTEIRFMNVSFWEDMAFTTELVTKVDKAVLLSDVTYHYIRHEGSLSHYYDRDRLKKDEILRNVSILQILKDKAVYLSEKPYIAYLCYNLEMSSFYAVCYILRNYNIINPTFSSLEMKNILKHPMSINEIWKFKNKRFSNLSFFFLALLPNSLFVLVIRLIGKMKNAF